MTQTSENLADRNVERLIRRWADPQTSERTDAARLAFLERASGALPSVESPRHRRWGLLATAAGLLVCAAVYGSLFLAAPASPGQADPRIRALIEELDHAEVGRRDRAAADLVALGATARPSLEKAIEGGSEGIRIRGRDVLDRIAGIGTKEAAALRDAELERQKNLVRVLDAECSAKAARISDLQRQLAAYETVAEKYEADFQVLNRQLEVQLAQIRELEKKLDDARKKK